jgi:tripartite-type tricarboxylate transporter receptor subunit TctC
MNPHQETTTMNTASKTALKTALAALLHAGIAATLLGVTGAARAEWPDKPVRLIVPFPPGGGSDMTARVVSQKLGERLGQTVIVDNRPGAASNIGMEAVARAPADGYTLLFAVPTVAQNPFLYKLAFDPRKDLAPVARLTEVSFVLLSSNAFVPRTLADAMKLAREQPGKVTCGSAGATPGIGCQMLRLYGKADVTIVPYKGNAPAMTDLIGGQIDLLFDVVNAAQPQVASGRVRALATTDRKRGNPPFPDLPAASEAVPGLELAAWQALMVPAKTPPAIVQRLEREMAAVMADPAVIQKLREGGIEPAYSNAAEFARTLQGDYERYGRIIKESGMTAY